MKRKNTPEVSQDHSIETGKGDERGGGKDSTQENQTGLGRRRFLSTGLTATAAAIVTTRKSLASPQHDEQHMQGGAQGRRTAARPQRMKKFTPVRLQVFPQPVVYESTDNVLDLPMTVSMLPNTQIRAYNGNVPGPTIMIKAGDQLKVTLDNQLPPNPGGSLDLCGQPNEMSNPHCFNSTNLHFHGLHVSPMSIYGNGNNKPPTLASDDVLIDVKPGSTQQYCIQLPSFHAPGTHWYHAHKHGSAALQLANGLCGALVVDEPDDQKIIPWAHKDYIWLMQELLPNTDAQLIYTPGGAQASQFYINGQYQPTMTMLSGEIQRWRFINGTGTPRGLCQLALVKCGAADCSTSAQDVPQTMYLIAMDGISFYGKSPQPVTALNFVAGNRADFLVQLMQPGRYKVMKNLFPWGGPGQKIQPQVLGYINVLPYKGTASVRDIPDTIPGTPPNYLKPIIEFKPNAATANFAAVPPFVAWNTVCPGVPQPPAHPAGLMPGFNVINCKEYMPPSSSNAPPEPNDMFQPKLNTSEQWILQNSAGSTHPFHVHVNPFQVENMKIDPNGPDDPTNWMFLDTVPNLPSTGLVPTPANGTPAPPWYKVVGGKGQVQIRTRFADYYGRYVMHCHILVHEDMGMMANIYVLNDGSGTGPCQKL